MVASTYMPVCLNMKIEKLIQLVKQETTQVSHICGSFLHLWDSWEIFGCNVA